MFGTLDSSKESRRRRSVAFTCGLLSETLLIAAAALLGLVFPEELPEANRHYALTWLAALRPPPPAPVLKPPPKVVRVVVPKLKPLETPALIAPPVAELAVPKVRPTIPSAAVHIPEPPPMPVAQPRPEPKVQIPVHTGLFGGGAEAVTTKLPVEKVQTGGFGSPQGLPGRAQGESAGNVPKLGSFGLPDGPGVGNGTGGAHGVQGVVASAGFGSGIAGPGTGAGGGAKVAVGGFGGTSQGRQSPSGSPKVATGGFEKAAPAAPSTAAKPQADPPTVFQPVEIFSKPTPAYTEEARRLGIQGEVTLSVVFQATGAIKVIGVIKSLGHGLDQAAEQAATQIRFKPALRDGKPADFPATLRIEFRLADQSS